MNDSNKALGLWFWAPVLTANGLLAATGLVWYRHGWKWAIGLLIGGPILCLFGGFVALVLFFLFDGHEPKCECCGKPAPFQMRGQRYKRRYCEPCDRRLAGLPPIEPRRGVEDWKL